MKRREFIILLGGATATWPVAARAQEPGRIYRLGVLTGAARQAPRMVAFFDELKVFGFVEEQNLKTVVGGFDLRDDQFAEVAATLARAAPDVVFCVSDAATDAAQHSAYTVPIVALSPDMVGAGLVRSLARPGGNITGVSILAHELNGKRLEILMEVVIFTAGAPEQIASAMEKAKASGATALNVLTAPLFSFNRRTIIERAAALGLPAIYEWPEMAEEGGLLGYGPRLNLILRQAARLVVKVLRGVKPEDLPVEQPTNFDLVINLTTAKALGLAIPESFLVRADEVIE
jgi:putative ABC transport system substrate-binding protein